MKQYEEVIQTAPERECVYISVQALFVSGKFQKQFRTVQRTGDDEIDERWESIVSK